jgi:hypothetical protein
MEAEGTKRESERQRKTRRRCAFEKLVGVNRLPFGLWDVAPPEDATR